MKKVANEQALKSSFILPGYPILPCFSHIWIHDMLFDGLNCNHGKGKNVWKLLNMALC